MKHIAVNCFNLDMSLILQDVAKGEEPIALTADKDGPLVALAFKLEENRFGQLTYMRIYSGTISKGATVTNMATGKRIKVSLKVKSNACCPRIY